MRCALIRQLAERLGLNPSDCRFDSCLGHRHVLAEQPGVLATLSRWRTTAARRCPGSNPIGDAFFDQLRQRGTQTGKAAKLKPSRLWVRFPPVLLTCVGWALASLSGRNPPAPRALQVQLLPGALTWPVRLEAGDQPASCRSVPEALNLARPTFGRCPVRFPHGSLTT